MNAPDKKKKHYAFCFFFVFFIVIAAEMLRALKVDWFNDLIACVLHGEQPSEQCLHTRSHNSTSTKGKNHVFVLLLNNSDSNSYMTFETRCVEAHCLLTGTSQRQLLNVTLRDVGNDANC